MKKLHYFFIGIGGISMSGLAKFLQKEGHKISGSDINPEVTLPNAKIFHGHSKNNIQNVDVVVYNNAIQKNNPELLEAKRQKIRIMSRAELLAEIASKYKNVISVSGMHGKTTVTEMIAEILITAGKKPTVHIGGISKCFNSNILIGKKDFFVTEACEYKDSFLTLKSNYGIILNIEPEHLDYFKNFNNIKKSFEKFANNSKQVIINNELMLNNSKILQKNSNYYAKNIIKNNFGYIFDCFNNKNFVCQIKLNAIGIHNIENALTAISVCKALKIKTKHIQKALENFQGTKRRMEKICESPLVFHDYAHHPSQIIETIKTIQEFYKEKILVVFQPHTFSRTKSFFNEFVDALKLCDKTILFKTYSARENKINGATAFDLYERLKQEKSNTEYFEDFKLLKEYLLKQDDYLILILGAGDIENLANKLKK